MLQGLHDKPFLPKRVRVSLGLWVILEVIRAGVVWVWGPRLSKSLSIAILYYLWFELLAIYLTYLKGVNWTSV